MAKFRKVPIEVEAEQYLAELNEPDGLCWDIRHGANCPHVHGLSGAVVVHNGDWIITGVDGKRYPCDPEIFARTYEPVEEVTDGS